MAALLFDGRVHPQAPRMARATQVGFQIDGFRIQVGVTERLMGRKARAGNVFDPVTIGDVYHHAS
jgi:hypothetical protein